MIEVFVYISVGFIIGFFGSIFFSKDKDLDTDTCLEYLKDKGYYVRLNNLPGKKL